MVVYVDSSVLLARLFDEPRQPRHAFWTQLFVSSRLLRYEVTVRIHALKQSRDMLSIAEDELQRIRFADLDLTTLARALEPFPLPLRTLDAFHAATMVFLRTEGFDLQVATYDHRLAAVVTALGFPLADV